MKIRKALEGNLDLSVTLVEYENRHSGHFMLEEEVLLHGTHRSDIEPLSDPVAAHPTVNKGDVSSPYTNELLAAPFQSTLVY